jgi:hypothetical protein
LSSKIRRIVADPLLSRVGILVCLIASALGAHAQLPFERAPINYSQSLATDPVALLKRKWNTGERVLRTEPATGYLRSLLEQLEIPLSSQTLVFSKTSLQKHLISPTNPRAIYFNDNVYVAWVPDGKMIEIAASDPQLGTVFYTLDQPAGRDVGKIVRKNDRCLFCHASSDTGRIPGLLMGSVYTDPKGNRVFSANAIPTDSDGPLQGRWAGWFVSGTHGKQTHLGNMTINPGDEVSIADVTENANVTDLSRWFDVAKYPSPHSDIVALLVLRHQVTMHNLLTDANHRSRIQLHLEADAQRVSPATAKLLDELAEQLVDGLLMIAEARFSDRIAGTSSFADEFARRGPRDAAGRSLRQLDLADRLFRYPCSFLIYSDSFDSLPPALLERTYRLLLNVWTGKDTRKKYSHLSNSQRSELLQILVDTKDNLPAGWKEAVAGKQ